MKLFCTYIFINVFFFAGCSKSFSPEPYLEDFEALKNHISRSYANLEPLLDHRQIDPYELNRTTIEKIKSSKNAKEAKEALISFAKTFKDGHFNLREPKKTKKADREVTDSISRDLSGEQACKAMGFSWKKKFDFKFPIQGVDILEQGGEEFPYLIVKEAADKIGIIRVADFRPSVYSKICMKAWESYKGSIDVKCDEDCQDSFKYEYLRKAIVNNFYQSLENVRNQKISSLVVDLTYNGGGSDWVQDITFLLTSKKLICGKSGFVKHPHHANNFKEMLAEIKEKSPNDKEKISNMELNVQTASELCDRTPLWSDKGHKLSCTLIGYRKREKCVYSELNFENKKRYDGKLFLLTNDYTASAAEDIVMRHKDSDTGVIIGGRTYGAGCGYMNGGIKFQLPNSKLDVRVPDCVRESANGINEVIGIEPDIKIDMSKIKEPSFLRSVVKVVLGN